MAPSVILNALSLLVAGTSQLKDLEERKAPEWKVSESLNDYGAEDPPPPKPTPDYDVK